VCSASECAALPSLIMTVLTFSIMASRAEDAQHTLVSATFEHCARSVRFFPWQVIPTVSLDVISLVASSCGYYRGQIEQCAAHEFAVHVAT
jgi:hypothetical protein